MAEEPGSERLMDALAAWYLALEDSQAEPDLLAICEGDEELAQRARGVLNRTPAILDAFDVGRADEGLPRFDDFQLMHEIGAGGAGTVFVARQRGLARVVAVKVLRRDALGGQQGRARMRREAELMAALDHPCIAPVYAVGTQDDVDYIAMKLLEGPSLAALLERPEQRRAAELARDVAAALELAHSHGVVHRDVKPANILLHKGRAVLVDFGLARSAIDTTLTREGAVPGTLAYIAPEQLQASRPPMDPRADVYSLGATLYELLTGRPPFDAARPEALMHAIVMEDAPSLRKLGIDRDLAAITEKALEKELQRRYPSVAELGADLARYIDGKPVQARPIGTLDRLRRRVRRNPRAAGMIGVGTAVVLMLGALALAAERDRRAGFVSALESAGAALEGDRLGEAQRQIALASDLGRGAQLDALAERFERMNAFEALFDLVLTRGFLSSSGDIERALGEFEARGSAAVEPQLGPLLVALAHHRQFHDQRAAEAASRAPDRTRATCAVRALLGTGSWDLPAPAPDELVGEALVSALAMYAAGRPLELQRAELERALDRQPGNERALFALVSVLSVEGRHGEALRLLRAVEGSQRLQRRRARTEISERIALEDFGTAQRLLDELPYDTRNSLEHRHATHVLLALEGFEAGLAYVEPLATGPAPSVRARLDHAEVLGLRGPADALPEAIGMLEALTGEPLDRIQEQRVHAALFMLRVLAALDGDTEIPRQLGSDVRGSLEAAGQLLLERFTLAEPRARVHLALGLLLRYGDLDASLAESIAQFERACALAPAAHDARSHLVLALHHRMSTASNEFDQYWACGQILARVQALSDAHARGDVRLPYEWPLLVRAAAEAAATLTEPDAVARWVSLHLDHVASGVLPVESSEEEVAVVSWLLMTYCALIDSVSSDVIDESTPTVTAGVPALRSLGLLDSASIEQALEYLKSAEHPALPALAGALRDGD